MISEIQLYQREKELHFLQDQVMDFGKWIKELPVYPARLAHICVSNHFSCKIGIKKRGTGFQPEWQ
jgi:hypothetical protein